MPSSGTPIMIATTTHPKISIAWLPVKQSVLP
jgi:hypothetical protein